MADRSKTAKTESPKVSTDSKKCRKKFVPLELLNENPLLPGRHRCDCEASKHDLLNNCLHCGRVVCQQEGAGPCFTCNHHVYSRQEQQEIEEINRKICEHEIQEAAKQQKLKKEKTSNLKDIAAVLSLDKAQEQKDRLLEYDRNSERRTKVIDDEMDYFDMSRQNWLQESKREQLKNEAQELHEKKFVNKSEYVLDLAAGGLVEVIKPEVEDFHKKVEELNELAGFKSDYEIVDFQQIMDREIELHPFYVRSETIDGNQTDSKQTSKKNKNLKSMNTIYNLKATTDPLRRIKIQDPALMSIHDDGFCMTIQQPYASLAMAGIKLHEGRKWFTPYRGRLWIHSSAKSPRQEEIQEAQQMFKFLMKTKPKFPKNYPLSSLLGCVELKDCLLQQDYRQQYPNGYCDDEYVFILDNPIWLKNFLPASGKQKIFKLDEKLHKAAMSQLAL